MDLVNLTGYYTWDVTLPSDREISLFCGIGTGGEPDEVKVSRPVRGAAGGKDSFESAPPADSIKVQIDPLP